MAVRNGDGAVDNITGNGEFVISDNIVTVRNGNGAVYNSNGTACGLIMVNYYNGA